MKRWLIALVAVFAFGALASVGNAGGYGDDKRGDGNGKVTICHVPPGNPGNAHTIRVGAPALIAHLKHGDSLGPCKKDDNGKNGKNGKNKKKLPICHVPPGNPGNAHAIKIKVRVFALIAHLKHGDYLGPCKDDDGKKDDARTTTARRTTARRTTARRTTARTTTARRTARTRRQ